MKFDMIKDITTLTTIAEKSLIKINDLSVDDICHCVLESVNCGDDVADIDIGIGELKVIVSDGELHYRFTPSNQLEKKLIKTFEEGVDPLTQVVEESLSNKILRAYKELI
jgi:hypothetical protein